jgi:hypothetical protein
MAAKEGPNFLFCMPNRTKCTLSVSEMPCSSSLPSGVVERVAAVVFALEQGDTGPRVSYQSMAAKWVTIVFVT